MSVHGTLVEVLSACVWMDRFVVNYVASFPGSSPAGEEPGNEVSS